MSGSTNKHAKLAPSASHRWTNCTASVSKIDQLVEEGILKMEGRSSYAAKIGTEMHDLAEEFIKWELFGEPPPLEDAPDQLKLYIDHCLSLPEDGDEVLVEDHVPLFYSPEETGTADFVVLAQNGDLYLRDLKWGMKPVESENNPQLAIYAYSIAIQKNLPENARVDIAVVQPRLTEEIHRWVLTVNELKEFCIPLEGAAKSIQNSEGLVFRPSASVCQWCPAKSHCAARIGPVMGIVNSIPLDAVESDDLTQAQRLYLWENRERITSLMRDIQSSFYEEAMDGNPPPGTKLVEGRPGNRKWASTEMETALMLQELGVEPYVQSLISPAQAEKQLKDKGAISSMVSRPNGKPVLADKDDKRPEYSDLDRELFNF